MLASSVRRLLDASLVEKKVRGAIRGCLEAAVLEEVRGDLVWRAVRDGSIARFSLDRDSPLC
jgi:hypothetical protein